MGCNGRSRPCPNVAQHDEAPHGYREWHAWAEEKAKTHDQKRCPGCGLYTVWVPRAAALPGGQDA